jgi:DNA-binding transcriptional ArsR family regulator
VEASTDCLEILKAFSDRSRQRIVKALLLSDLGVNELAEKLQITQYNVS